MQHSALNSKGPEFSGFGLNRCFISSLWGQCSIIAKYSSYEVLHFTFKLQTEHENTKGTSRLESHLMSPKISFHDSLSNKLTGSLSDNYTVERVMMGMQDPVQCPRIPLPLPLSPHYLVLTIYLTL